MNVSHVLCVHDGDVLNSLRNFLSRWWEHMELAAMLAPVELPNESEVIAQAVEDPADLAMVNPFAPVMLCNAASVINDFLKDHPQGRLAIMLRPCELRTYIEINKRNKGATRCAQMSRLENEIVTIGVDCPGTYSAAEYARRIKLYGAAAVTREILEFSAERCYTSGQFRLACELCDWNVPHNADLTIGSLGVASQQYLLIIARDEKTDVRLSLEETTDGKAIEEQIAHRETIIRALVDQRLGRQARLLTARDHSFGELSGLLAHIARCTLCADCLDACPLYQGELSGMLGVSTARQGGRPLLPALVGVSRWLVSCSGCGMCQEACTQNVPLSLLVLALSRSIRDELHYKVGDPKQPLPWMEEI